ncbi:hypothetical protein FRB97_004458 [Tulasnella sp. 331]|nr:hypothetical protein FRB97_004458 [Tulasnella sp. 331]
MLDAAINKGINFVLMDRVCLPEGPRTSVKTENGAVIPTGMVIDAQRGKLNTDFLTSFNPTIVTETGGVKLLPTLQVPLANGKSNVFALGDIIEGPEQKTVFKLQLQAAIVSASTSWLPSKVLLLRVNIKATRDFVLGELLTSKLPSEHLTLNHASCFSSRPSFVKAFLGNSKDRDQHSQIDHVAAFNLYLVVAVEFYTAPGLCGRETMGRGIFSIPP